jgi:23S rRNA pseudouridine1911/1915/1917 synthase
MRNQGYAYTSIISSRYHGQPLLAHLAALYPHSSPAEWRQKLENGEVTLNGAPASGAETLAAGQTLIWNRPSWVEPAAPLHFAVAYRPVAHLANGHEHPCISTVEPYSQ